MTNFQRNSARTNEQCLNTAHQGKNIVSLSKHKRRQKKKGRTLNILYANVRGVRGKIASLQKAAETNQSHIVTVVETKGNPPKLAGYHWQNKPCKVRYSNNKGGVAIAVRNDLLPSTRKVLDNTGDLDILWTEVQANNTSLFIGTFYGKQETAPKEESEEEFSQLTTQIKRLQQKGEVILTGDFNAKLEIEKENITQKESSRGRLLKR